MKLAGLEWQKHQKLVSAHFTFDQFSGTILPDSSGNGNNGQLHGGPKWIEVCSFSLISLNVSALFRCIRTAKLSKARRVHCRVTNNTRWANVCLDFLEMSTVG